MNTSKRSSMSTELLSYDSLKTVLQHMEANLRFQLSKHIPSIRTAEKSIPLKIDKLEFYPMRIVVNDVDYMLGIYRNYHASEVPISTQKDNEEGGIKHDVDEYGVPDLSADKIVLPGDVLTDVFVDEPNSMAQMSDDEYIQNLEEHLRHLQRMLAKCLEKSNRKMSKTYQELIERKNQVLFSYNCRRSKVPPPYDSLIQLTIETLDFKKVVEHVNYNSKLHKAMKSLSERLFGNRRHIINVKTFVNGSRNKIIRLPLGVKFKICELNTCSNIVNLYKGLEPIVDTSSYPLDSLYLRCDTAENLDYSIVQTAAKLNLCWVKGDEPLLPALFHLQTREVNVECHADQFSIEDQILLIQNWLETGREVGTCFSFDVYEKHIVTNFMESIKNRFNCESIKERSAILRINTFSLLKISYKERLTPWYPINEWKLRIEVLSFEPST